MIDLSKGRLSVQPSLMHIYLSNLLSLNVSLRMEYTGGMVLKYIIYILHPNPTYLNF